MASFRKRGKKWEYRVSYTDENGNRKQMSEGGFNTKAEAQVVATDLENKLNKGYKYFRGKQLFPEYYEEWINRYKMGTHSAGSDVFYARTINVVTHYFEKQTLEEITRESYQDFINYYADNRGKERSVETVRKVHAIVSSSLKDAYKSGYITIDPTYRTQLKGRRTKGKQTKFLHEEEAKKLLEELLRDIKPHYITRYMAILQLATGMRISEVMALQEDDINFVTHKISITKSWDYNYTSAFSPTKNRTNRLISVDEDTLELIKDFINNRRHVIARDKHKRIFYNERTGDVPTPTSINKMLRKACKRANISVISSHALRHTHCSILILNGVNIAYISKRLGHLNISTTTNVYAHVLRELSEKSEDLSNQIFKGLHPKK